MSATTPTMFAVVRSFGYGKPQYVTLPLVTALVDRERYFVLTDELPPDDRPEPPPKAPPRRGGWGAQPRRGGREVIPLDE